MSTPRTNGHVSPIEFQREKPKNAWDSRLKLDAVKMLHPRATHRET
jgi:hypothetical protein